MDLLAAAKGGDDAAFSRLVEPYRRELNAHCYRMLGSVQDAEDAVQETLLSAWRGLAGFAERSSVRTWLHTIATNRCLRMTRSRAVRMLSWDQGPARSPTDELGAPIDGAAWIEPWHTNADDPHAVAVRRESIELAFVAAMQHLPPNQRAVLILREALGFSAAEVAGMLDTTVASVNSALQRARASLAGRASTDVRHVAPGAGEQRRIVEAFATAYESGDVSAVVELLSVHVRFTMPPLPAWFDGRDDVAEFLATRVFASPWRVLPTELNTQPALACYEPAGTGWLLTAVIVLSIEDGQVTWIASFVDPGLLARLPLAQHL